MKGVMLNIKTQRCVDILKGEVTAIISKTRPTAKLPFKAYIYCRNDTRRKSVKEQCAYFSFNNSGELKRIYPINGNVVGEFTCDSIKNCVSFFGDMYNNESIGEEYVDNNGRVRYTSIWSAEKNNDDYKIPGTKVAIEELKGYLGECASAFFIWHISDLKIYNEPKRLSDFHHEKRCEEYLEELDGCFKDETYALLPEERCKDKCITGKKCLKKPPISWCYVGENER